MYYALQSYSSSPQTIRGATVLNQNDQSPETSRVVEARIVLVPFKSNKVCMHNTSCRVAFRIHRFGVNFHSPVKPLVVGLDHEAISSPYQVVSVVIDFFFFTCAKSELWR